MPRLARFAPALIGLALAAPATARAQSHAHPAGSECAYCAANHATSLTPVVQERRGPLGLLGGRRVVVPAGHHVEGTVPAAPSWSSQAAALPPASAWGANPSDAGVAVIGPGYDPAPAMPYGGGYVAEGEPLPIGEMRTNYSPAMSSPMGPAGLGPQPAPMMRPDPAIQAWHQMGMAERSVPRHHGALSRMLGVASVSNWLEERRTLRVMRKAAKSGMYAPMMTEMPGRAVIGH
ncbi:hypothetical protein [Tautonia sociabilis]|uniref:Uncharacterized protein n=1 Tax=Tautonia sociabilis TaxID=2080755 RepID=A0A432MHL8_9BACT|nr:hypothetical protein [Tautonia sociabilis]RUL86314.1 hypothetical protein TsocGM_16430 [Tautonia sociabilis]